MKGRTCICRHRLTSQLPFFYFQSGSKEMQAQINNSTPELVYLDPVGAILICIYISISWCHTGWGMIYASSIFSSFLIRIITYEPPHDKINKVECAPSEQSDQPGHPPNLISVFAVRSVDS